MTAKERLLQAIETMTEEEAADALHTLAEASGDPAAWMLDHARSDDEPRTRDALLQRAAALRARQSAIGAAAPLARESRSELEQHASRGAS